MTCLVDLYRPSVAFAAIKLLEDAGCRVSVPRAQTCCGQPAFNSGDRATAQALARDILTAFRGYDYIVTPSGSCGGMLREHLPHLLADDPALAPAAAEMASRTYELVSFLTDIRRVTVTPAPSPGRVTYHDSCAGLRELHIKEQPRALLRAIGAEIVEMTAPETCCGFGGTFCVKYPAISLHMAQDKAKDIAETGAATVLAGDMGCLLNIAGTLSRNGSPVQVRHVAEILAGNAADHPAIGQSSGGQARRQ